MSKSISPSTYVRCLNFGVLRQLADFLDPQEGWKKIAVDIKKPSGEARYNQLHIRRFEGSVQMGKSPTCELLFDWGTTNCTVSDLVELLVRNQFLAAASLLLPDSIEAVSWTSQNTMPVHEIYMTRERPARKMEVPYLVPDSPCEKNSSQDNETGFRRFSFEELKKSTDNFDERPVSAGGKKLGEGGFGVVYRATINNRTVAVKKLTAFADISIQEMKDQFDQEIKTMAKCRHENLVELIGFCNDSDEHCLVYVYMPNGSLLDRLACLDGSPPLPWITRCNIVQGTAQGISFLHENNHTHRDIKSANILLSETFIPKISDFGLARACGQLKNTVMTDRIVGTTAYMAPEALRGEITIKSDIFSFGVDSVKRETTPARSLPSLNKGLLETPTVWQTQLAEVLLEIITGLPAVDEMREPQLLLDIKDEIEDEEKTIEDYVDEKIGQEYFSTVEEMFSLASRCLHQLKNRRPVIKTVQQDLEKMMSVLGV
ncbi:interleukin-1 receptor-associated kinase 4 isoform X2 [Rhinatrema bivittatum]|uniref:interleukin-1 receptor-associated kinase 4 isoform X2 n=1 Tax=Rhinatrema bivittatum TaxID=194408 RepID=UPI00112CB630|nr:interleukin-1 receptor-associated kinase 4 isoform X2 [Rhinatrema bivittatum]